MSTATSKIRAGGSPRSGAGRALIKKLLIVGDSTEMSVVVEKIEDAAQLDVPVLIDGEPGSGRELIARAIHYASRRRAADFVAVRAANIPKPLIDVELFGTRSGTLRRAQGGTLLVKDVDTLPRGPQRGLAGVLERDAKTEPSVDVRLIGASNTDLEQSVAANYFDRALYDRLGARKISIPPLRRRAADLPRLVRHFLDLAAEEKGKARVKITDAGLERLARYGWPGNVAELKNMSRRLVALLSARGKRGPLDAADVDAVLPETAAPPPAPPPAERVPAEEMPFEELVRAKLKTFIRQLGSATIDNLYDEVIARVERPLLSLVMEHTAGNQLRAAQLLGLNRNTLRKKLAERNLADDGETRSPRRRK
jgi:two-component system nitrogen regulation response regulator GlnG